MTRLMGKVALATGTTTGIGRAMIERCATEGARVVGAGRRADEGEAIVAALRARGDAATSIATEPVRR
jgi:NAD(P)-dependent dehydrogenase (short-subunit alcohol dehydrogenase family)